MEILIIGGSHGGVMFAKTIKKLNPSYNVTLIERNQYLAYVASSLRLGIKHQHYDVASSHGQTISDLEHLGVHVFNEMQAFEVNSKQQRVTCVHRPTQKLKKFDYDYLIMATGTTKISNEPRLNTYDNVYFYRNYPEAEALYYQSKNVDNITMIGSGYAGMELADELANQGKNITVIEHMSNPFFKNYDQDIANYLLQYMPSNIKLYLSEQVLDLALIESEKIVQLELLHETIDVEMLIMNSRLVPNTILLAGIVDLNYDNTVKVNQWYQTSDAHIFAIGDTVRHQFLPVEEAVYLPLVANATYSATTVAYYLSGYREPLLSSGVNRTTVNALFGRYIASTGLLEEEASYYGKKVKTHKKILMVYKENGEQVPMLLKLIIDLESNKLLGAQYVTEAHQLELINILSMLISKHYQLEEILQLDYFFTPGYASIIHPIKQIIWECLDKTEQ